MERLQKAYPSAAKKVQGFAASMGDEATLDDEVKGLFEKAGELDHVVYTAGDSLATIPIREVTLEQIKKAGMVRYFAVLIVAKYAAKHLESSTSSSFTIATGSVSERPIPGWTIVNGFATGLHGVTRGLALDLKPLRVNLVSPGPVDTELWDSVPAEQRKEMLKSFGEKMATGAVGQVEDVAESFIYCMKDKNLTGSMISTSGGILLM